MATPKRPWSLLVVLLSLLLSLLLFYFYSAVFGPLLLALALAYMLEPIVLWLQKRGLRRPAAVNLLFGLSFLLGLVLLLWIGVQGVAFWTEITREGGLLTSGVERVQSLLQEYLAAEGNKEGLEQQVQTYLGSDAWKTHLKGVFEVLQNLVTKALSGFGLLSVLLLMPIYMYCLMLDLPRIWEWIKAHLPAYDRDRTMLVLEQCHLGLAAFLRGRLLLALVKGGLTAIGLFICGTPMALPLGLAAGFLSILPFVGPVIGYVLAAAFTLAQQGSPWSLAYVGIVFVVAEILEGVVLMPWIMSKGAELGTLAILFSVVFWSAALGMFGAMVAIPLTLILKILLQRYVFPAVEDLAAKS